MKFERFELERWQSEMTAEINLSGAGCMRLSYADLLGGRDLDLKQDVVYGSTMGSVGLRERVVGLYPNAKIAAENVMITSGTAEANTLILSTILDPGDEFVTVNPTYYHTPGLAGALGAKVKMVNLHEDEGWALHLDEMEAAITPRTKLVVITNPNNPQGSRLGAEALKTICGFADKVGAYVMTDEALRGLEMDETNDPSPVELYERGISTGSVSKLGIPGMRIGWMIASRAVIGRCWEYKDYTTLCHGGLMETIAEIALQPESYKKFRARARKLARERSAILMDWVNRNPKLSCVPPKAGFTAFPKFEANVDSVTFCKRAALEHGVLPTPGDFAGAAKHFRIRYGVPEPTLHDALGRLDKLLATL